VKTSLADRNYLRQSPSLVNGKYSLTSSESNLIYMLLTQIDKDDEDFKDYQFTKKDLEKKLGRSIHPGQLRSTAESLMSKVLRIERSENDWELLSWFSYFGYRDGVITCTFDKRLKPYLLKVKPFVLSDFRHLVQMRSEYSKRIYLLLKERAGFGERKFSVEDLMERLEVPKSLQVYADFKRKVLLQAVKDINKYSDLEVKNLGTGKKPTYFKEIKNGRKINEVVFYFQKNWNDLKSFIEWIRECYTNQPLYYSKDKRLIKCDENGLLYYADETLQTLDAETAKKAWSFLFDKREDLLCFQIEDEVLER